MNPMNLVVVLIAYYPDRDALKAWSEAAQRGVPLRIWDNTPGGCQVQDEFPSLEFLGTGHNLGVGPALKRLLNELQEQGLWDKALYLDQDAEWTITTYQWAAALHDSLLIDLEKDNNALVGLCGGCRSDGNQKALAPVRIMMTNGMIFPIKETAALLNTYNPFFMECVDYQVCYRAKLRGWALFVAQGCPDLKHDPTRPSIAWSNGIRTFHKRIYPSGRGRRFLLNLAVLALHAFSRLNFPYLWVFLRNILTHVAYRTWFDAVWYLRASGRQT